MTSGLRMAGPPADLNVMATAGCCSKKSWPQAHRPVTRGGPAAPAADLTLAALLLFYYLIILCAKIHIKSGLFFLFPMRFVFVPSCFCHPEPCVFAPKITNLFVRNANPAFGRVKNSLHGLLHLYQLRLHQLSFLDPFLHCHHCWKISLVYPLFANMPKKSM